MPEICFDNYDCFTNCFSGSAHLGVAIYVKKFFNAQKLNLKPEHEKAKESVWAEIKLENDDSLLIGCIYRPPSNSDMDNKLLYETILSMIDGKSHVLIGGDFNQPNIDWINETSPASKEHPASIFLEFVRDTFLYQHIKEPTHFRGTQTPTLIDLVFSSEENMVKNVRHEAPFGKSHHQVLHFDFVCYTLQENKCGTMHNYKKADYEKMKEYVKQANLTEKINSKQTEQSWNIISNCILSSVELYVPKIHIKKNRNIHAKDSKKPKWWNEKSKDKIMKKRDAYQKWLRTQDDEDWNLYAKARNQSKTECRRSDIEYQKSVARDAKNKPKVFYAYTKSKLKVSEGIGDLTDCDGNKVTDNEDKAKMLNDFFCSVFTQERMDDIPTCENQDPETFLDNVIFTKEAVLKKLKGLNASKSGGPDSLTAGVLKELADVIAEPIAVLFNKSMSEGILPKNWKDANVTPLFKKGDKSKTNNYRPVSLTCILCKVMESIIRDKMMAYFESNNYLSEFQHGFVSHRSCTTNLLATLDSWTESLDRGAPVDAIYLDFSKAFDSVPHHRLLEKLKMYGISDKLLLWIKDFLIGRRQRVNVNGCYSDWSPVTSGVPQGSCLGPVLFVVFINDLPEVVKSLVQMYADDTKLFSEVENIEQKLILQRDLYNLMDWADKWQLRFNADKCHVVHLGFNNNHYTYYMRKHDEDNFVELLTSEVEKDLGVQVDDKLSFTKHVQCQVNKANRLVGLIRRSFSFLDKDVMRQLFTAIVRPHLEFANVVWSPRYKREEEMIEKVQERATKCIPGMKNLSYEDRLKVMKLPSLKYRRKRGDLIETYKYTHSYYNVNANLLKRDDKSNLRGHSYKLSKQPCKLDIRQKFFSFRIVNLWNKLPSTVVEAPSVDSFKARLDHHLESEMYCA